MWDGCLKLSHLHLFVFVSKKNANLTFPVDDREVWIAGAYAEDKLVSNEGFIRVNGAYGLNQLRRTEEQCEKTHEFLVFFFLLGISKKHLILKT